MRTIVLLTISNILMSLPGTDISNTKTAVFCVFSVLYLREPLVWNYVLGFSLMAGAVFVIFKEW